MHKALRPAPDTERTRAARRFVRLDSPAPPPVSLAALALSVCFRKYHCSSKVGVTRQFHGQLVDQDRRLRTDIAGGLSGVPRAGADTDKLEFAGVLARMSGHRYRVGDLGLGIHPAPRVPPDLARQAVSAGSQRTACDPAAAMRRDNSTHSRVGPTCKSLASHEEQHGLCGRGTSGVGAACGWRIGRSARFVRCSRQRRRRRALRPASSPLSGIGVRRRWVRVGTCPSIHSTIESTAVNGTGSGIGSGWAQSGRPPETIESTPSADARASEVLVGLGWSSHHKYVVDAMGADWVGTHPQRGEFCGGVVAQPPAHDRHFAGRGSVLAHRQPEQRGVFPKVTPTRARGIEVDRAVDRVGLAWDWARYSSRIRHPARMPIAVADSAPISVR